MTFHRSAEDPDAVVFDLPNCDRAKARMLQLALGGFLEHVEGVLVVATQLETVIGIDRSRQFRLHVFGLTDETAQVAQDFIHGFLAREEDDV